MSHTSSIIRQITSVTELQSLSTHEKQIVSNVDTKPQNITNETCMVPSSHLTSQATAPTVPPSSQGTRQIVTRSNKGIFKTKVFAAALEPTTVEEALQKEQWKATMTDEFSALMRNGSWSLVPLLERRKAIGCKWVFKVKENPDGTISKYKPRLVAKGFHQIAGFDFTETFSPVAKPTTIRVVLTVALMKGWNARQLDINNAFLNRGLQEEVFRISLRVSLIQRIPVLSASHTSSYMVSTSFKSLV